MTRVYETWPIKSTNGYDWEQCSPEEAHKHGIYWRENGTGPAEWFWDLDIAEDAAAFVVKLNLVPPDPEKENDRRATDAAGALGFSRGSQVPEEHDLSDLLCNLMHWADRSPYDFEVQLERARRNYEEETRADT